MKELRTLAIAAMTVVGVLATTALSQTVPDNQSKPASSRTAPDNNSKPAPNAWILTPTPYLQWNKDMSPSLRAERDEFWDNVSTSDVPITSPSYVAPTVGVLFSTQGPEIPDSPNRAIVTATFTNHRSVLSASEFSMYTEVMLRVDEVFEDRTGSGELVKGREITLLSPGGTVMLSSGEKLTAGIPPGEPPLAPGHKYLFVMSYHPKGDFYEEATDWDISDGVVRPNTDRNREMAKEGRSSLSGVSVQQIGAVLDKELYGQK